MKRKLSVLLAALLCALSLASCGAPPAGISESAESSGKTSGSSSSGTVDKDALRVCVDLEYRAGYTEGKTPENAFYNLMNTVKSLGGPENVSFEYLPREGTERETALDRVRTEIMSGGGPDMFIIACNGGIDYMASDVEALFRVPEKAMEAGLFLPLDDYIQNAQFMEWNKLNETVMAAGKAEQGQLILPLTYTFPVTVYRADDVPNLPDKSTTWADEVSGDIALQASGAWGTACHEDLSLLNNYALSYILSMPVDYANETLSFTENELFKRISEMHDLKERVKAQKDTPDHIQFDMNVRFNDFLQYNDRYSIKDYEDVTFIPLYTTSGGATASIVSYAAINSNTKRAEDAFFILDVLMSSSMQRTSNFYKNLFDQCAIPMQTNLMLVDSSDTRVQGWGLSETNFNALCDTRKQITNVQFRSSVTMELDKLYKKCDADWGDEAAVRADISETYAAIMRLISE